MAGHFRFTSRPTRLAKLIQSVGDLFDHVFGEPYRQLSPVLSQRQQLAAAMEAARRLKRGAGR
ncbi:MULTISPECIES: hypothetical protein [unclassified Dyella]|jgi:hypothetical protein|uniref:hypothetical protein n=1 Tax=unclassified Dyella TaxID=2634549 RepID=UPI003F939FCE